MTARDDEQAATEAVPVRADEAPAVEAPAEAAVASSAPGDTAAPAVEAPPSVGAAASVWTRRRVAMMAAVALAWTFASPVHLPLNNPNEGVRVFMVKALVDERTFAINGVMQKWGYIDDKSIRDGKLYSSKAPLTAMIGAVAYGAARLIIDPLDRVPLTRFLQVFGDAVPNFLLLLVFAAALWRRVRDPVVGDLVVLGVAVGSCVLAYVHCFSGHTFAALGTGIALLLVSDDGGLRRPARLVLIGLCAATAVGVEYPALVGVVPLGVLLLWRERRRLPSTLLWGTLGALPPVALTTIAQHYQYGAFWKTGYAMLENRQYNQLHSTGFFGISELKIDRLGMVLFSAETGLFFFSPFLLVGALWLLYAIARGRAPRDEGLAILVGSLALFAFISGHTGWRGGWTVGPRYVSELVALFALPTALAFDRLAARRPLLARSALGAMVVVAFVHSGLPSVFFPHLPEVYRNPVYEMALPFVARGFSPDTWALWAGASARVSGLLLVVVVFLPLAFVAARPALVLGAGVAAVLVVFVFPLASTTDPAARSVESHRNMGNWIPDEGNPYLATPALREQGRAWLCVDEGAKGAQLLQAKGCAP